jgi:membrane protein implicated in regulation of membrane protease activity
MNKFFVALIAYVVLAALAWTTLSDPKFKFATLAILAMFAVRTWSWNKKLEREQREQSSAPRAVGHEPQARKGNI